MFSIWAPINCYFWVPKLLQSYFYCNILLHDHFEGCIEIANPEGLISSQGAKPLQALQNRLASIWQKNWNCKGNFFPIVYLVNYIAIYYCTIISRDALKLPIPRESFFIPRGEAPRDEKCLTRDFQFQCIPRNDRAIVFLHSLLHRQFLI